MLRWGCYTSAHPLVSRVLRLKADFGHKQMDCVFWVPRANLFARVLSLSESTLKQV